MLNGNPRIKTGAIWCPDRLRLKKLKFREGKFSPQGHTAINCQSWVWNSSLQVFLLVWFRAHLGEGSSLQRHRTQVVSPLALLVQAAGKLWMPLNRNHRPPQGPREGGRGLMAASCLVPGMAFPSSWRGREVSNITRDACSLQISAGLQGPCARHICSM